MSRKPMIALLVLGVVLILAAVVYGLVRGGLSILTSQTAKPPEITLPPSLEEWAEKYPELADILNDPELGSVYKEFLVVYEEEGEEAALELARERGILVTEEGEEYVHLILILDTKDNAGVVEELQAYDVKVFSAHEDRVSVGVPVEMVKQQLAAEDPGAIFEDLTEFDHVIAVRLPEPVIPYGSAIEGEGVEVIDAEAWHAAGITGEGLRIAVLDGGFEGYEDLLGKELPDNVTFMPFGPDRTSEMPEAGRVHGTACAEIVHEIAPGAELLLAQFGDSTSWADALVWLGEQDVDIVSHSMGWSVGPRDDTSWHAEKVDDLVSTYDILWVNAAGNEARSHYRAVFTDEDGDGLHDFAPGENLMPIYNQGSVFIALQWDDDWEAPTQDYQLYAFDEAGNLLAPATDVQSGEHGQYPVEIIQGSTGGETVYIAVEAYDIDAPVVFDIFVPKSLLEEEYSVPSYSLGIPADARNSLSVGAANWNDDSLPVYSSWGPTEDGRPKPEISAPTGVQGASYGALGARFTGTSASCPHVAGAAALVWQAYPGSTRREVVDFLLANAVDLGPAGPDYAFGYGRLQLPGAEPIGPTAEPTATPVLPTDTPMPTDTSMPTTTAGPTATPGSTSTPFATDTPVPSDTPSPTATNTPEPEPTEVVYAQPTLPPPPGTGLGTGTLLAGTLVGVIGLGCGGVVLLLIGGIGLIILRRRGRRAEPVPQPPRPGPSAPPSVPQPQAIRCPHCGAPVRPGARFCSGCGRSIASARQCSYCGAVLSEGARFCPRCGRSVP